MSDFVVVNGDQVTFLPVFGAAFLISPPPGQIEGTGETVIGGEKVCIEGDEASVKVENVPYAAPPYVGGMGTIVIDSLDSSQFTEVMTSGGKPMVLMGKPTMIKAIFKVKVGGFDTQGVQDQTKEYPNGMGTFISNNTKFKAT